MNILFLCEGNAESWDAWSGICKSIVDHLRANGHTVETRNLDLTGADKWIAAAATVATNKRRWGTRYHLGPVPFALRSRRASRYVAERRSTIDAIVQVGATFEVTGAEGIPYFLCCDSNIRMAQYGQSTGYSDASPLSEAELAAIGRREANVYRKADVIFPLSERLRRSFVDDFAIPADRVRAIYAGPNFVSDRATSAGSGMPAKGAPTALFVGLQFHRKGGDILVESFRRVRAQLPDAQLLLAGVPADFIQEPGITCLGILNKNQPSGAAALADAYASADVFVLPTRFEPFGIVFVEAMHFGLPCIGPNSWAVPEIIADGETGFTVPIDNVDALTDRLVRLLGDRSLASTMGRAGQERARQLFTWPHVVERMTDGMTAVMRTNAQAH